MRNDRVIERSSVRLGIVALAMAGLGVLTGAQQPSESPTCMRPLPDPIMTFDVPSGEIVETRDGCWLFAVSVDATLEGGGQTKDGIAALRRSDKGFELHRFLPLRVPQPGGLAVVGTALTRDERMLVVSHDERLTFLDVGTMTAGRDDPVMGFIESPRLSRSWGVVVSTDDKYAYAAQQGNSSVVIIDLDVIRKGVFDQSALVGIVPTAQGATTPALSPDGRYLFTTTLRAPDVVDAPLKCQGGKAPEGAIQVIDVQRARTNAATATVNFAYPAGCNPVFMTLSPDGTRLSVAPLGATGQGTALEPEHAIVVFDTSRLSSGEPPAVVGRVPVGPQPVRVVDTGDRLVVAFSHSRAPAPEPARVTVIDASKVTAGKQAVLGKFAFGALGMKLSGDRRTVFFSVGAWNQLIVADLQRAELVPPAK
jgi:DNA-binding beta-propeller fold protein YncE